jgi:hypothetical protein
MPIHMTGPGVSGDGHRPISLPASSETTTYSHTNRTIGRQTSLPTYDEATVALQPASDHTMVSHI